MSEVWTHGLWVVKQGQEKEFVAAWEEMAHWTKSLFPERWAVLMQVQKEPSVFHSFGPWHEEDDIQKWQSHPEHEQYLDNIKAHAEKFKPELCTPVSKISS